jgi:hypothetical protein
MIGRKTSNLQRNDSDTDEVRFAGFISLRVCWCESSYEISPPDGMSQKEFDDEVRRIGDGYRQGPYGPPGRCAPQTLNPGRTDAVAGPSPTCGMIMM